MQPIQVGLGWWSLIWFFMANAAAKSSCLRFSLKARIFFRPPLKDISLLEDPGPDLAASGSGKKELSLKSVKEPSK